MQPSYEHVRRSEHESLQVKAYRQDAFPFEWHVHPEWELTYIVDGSGQRYVGDSVEEAHAGELVLLSGNLPHTWHAEPKQAASCAAVVVYFPEKAIPDQPEMRRVHRLMHRAECGLVFAEAVVQRVRGDVMQLADLGTTDRWITFLHIMDQLARSRSARQLSAEPYARSVRPTDQQAIDRVCRWVIDHIDHEIRQADAAALIHRSPSAFARFFKRMMGQTFIDYVVQVRVGRACRMLMETDLAITEVCYRAGFTNLSYFNRAFRRWRKTTPGAYRRAFVSATDQ